MIDVERLNDLFGNDADLLNKFFQKVRRSLPSNLLELEAAIHTKDLANASLLVHDLKNHLRYLGQYEVAKKTEELEFKIDNGEFNEKDLSEIENLKPTIRALVKELEKLIQSTL